MRCSSLLPTDQLFHFILVLPTGVLALLQEAGEPAAVVAAGEGWLAQHGGRRRDGGTADVALALAQARCDMAQAALEGQGDVIQVAILVPGGVGTSIATCITSQIGRAHV